VIIPLKSRPLIHAPQKHLDQFISSDRKVHRRVHPSIYLWLLARYTSILSEDSQLLKLAILFLEMSRLFNEWDGYYEKGRYSHASLVHAKQNDASLPRESASIKWTSASRQTFTIKTFSAI
jgi:hypothetical protein